MNYEADPTTYNLLDNDKIQCNICQRKCQIPEGKTGFCSGYQTEQGTLRDLTYGRITTAQVTELGWAPISTFANPSDSILSIGSRGCNLRCDHCVNYTHAFARHDSPAQSEVPPEVLVDYAKSMNCKGIAANFNEGLLAARYWADTFQLAKHHDLYTVAVTNGYATPEVLDLVCPHLDVYRCDIKAFERSTMTAQGNRGVEPQGILSSLKYVKETHPQTHIETVTMISPNINDHPQELAQIASWIRENLGPDTPWHISPMEPTVTSKSVNSPPYIEPNQLLNNRSYAGTHISFEDQGIFLTIGDADLISLSETDIDPQPLERAVEIAKQVGLTNVFTKLDGH